MRPLTGAFFSTKYLNASVTSAACASSFASASPSIASISGSAMGCLLHGSKISWKRDMCVPLNAAGSSTVNWMRASTDW